MTCRATYAQPHAFCDGVSHVAVNGRLVIDDGEHTTAAAGQVLRHPPRRPAAGAARREVARDWVTDNDKETSS
jgi:hypothetical protein